MFPIHVIPHDFHISPHSLPNQRVRERDREEYSETGGSYTDFFTRGGYTEWLGATEGFSDGVSSESFDESSEETGEDDDEWGLEEWAGVQPSLDPPHAHHACLRGRGSQSRRSVGLGKGLRACRRNCSAHHRGG